MTEIEKRLDFGSDVSLRRALFGDAAFAHPAKLQLGLLGWLVERYTKPGDTIADCMAGSGSILLAATVARNVIAREIEPRWLAIMQANAEYIGHACLFPGLIDVGRADAREPWNYQADHIIFSPPYNNDFTAKSPLSRRGFLLASIAAAAKRGERSWQDVWDRKIGGAQVFTYGSCAGQIGHFRDKRYWDAMRQVYTQALQALQSNGNMVLVIKDHIRACVRVPVCDQTVQLCEQIGFRLVERHARLVHPLSLWMRRRKERGQPVVEDESVLCFEKAQ